MTREEMLVFAQRIVDGGPAKKSEVLEFMRAFVDPDLQVGGPGMTKAEVAERLPKLYFEIDKTDSGIHVPREVNRSYTKAEGAALLVMLANALK